MSLVAGGSGGGETMHRFTIGSHTIHIEVEQRPRVPSGGVYVSSAHMVEGANWLYRLRCSDGARLESVADTHDAALSAMLRRLERAYAATAACDASIDPDDHSWNVRGVRDLPSIEPNEQETLRNIQPVNRQGDRLDLRGIPVDRHHPLRESRKP